MEPSLFESSFCDTGYRNWFRLNNSIVYPVGLMYVVGSFWLKNKMRDRKPFELQRLLLAWNLFLAIFSILGAIRTLPEMLGHFNLEDPFYTSICTNDYRSRTHRFWSLLFILSKGPELVDTIFVVLRKRPLIFLHWYHHLTMFWVTWTSYHDYNSAAAWYVALNFTVHSFMYSYYALRTINIKVPKLVSMGITALQIIQMILGFAVTVFAGAMKLQGRRCETETSHIYASLIFSASYGLLFIHFFRKTYFKSTKTA